MEYYWNWEDFNVHVDHYYVDSSKKKHKLILLHGGGGNGRLLSPIGVFFQNWVMNVLHLIFPDLV